MTTARTLAACAFGVALLAGGASAQELLVARPLGPQSLSHYRDFTLKSSVTMVSAAAGIAASTAKTVHQRPAVLQDLELRPSRWMSGSATTSSDPVEQIVFSFCDDQLFRIVVDYARDRTQGMTDADMVEAIAEVYGAPGKRLAAASRVRSDVETESGSPVARWGDADSTIVLYRTSTFADGFRLIVTDSALDRRATKATLDAARLDERDAPRVELARQKKELDDSRVVAAKARAANKGKFRP